MSPHMGPPAPASGQRDSEQRFRARRLLPLSCIAAAAWRPGAQCTQPSIGSHTLEWNLGEGPGVRQGEASTDQGQLGVWEAQKGRETSSPWQTADSCGVPHLPCPWEGFPGEGGNTLGKQPVDANMPPSLLYRSLLYLSLLPLPSPILAPRGSYVLCQGPERIQTCPTSAVQIPGQLGWAHQVFS